MWGLGGIKTQLSPLPSMTGVNAWWDAVAALCLVQTLRATLDLSPVSVQGFALTQEACGPWAAGWTCLVESQCRSHCISLETQ